MLALSKKISCECLRVGVLVGDDQYFAGTGNKVDANLSVLSGEVSVANLVREILIRPSKAV